MKCQSIGTLGDLNDDGVHDAFVCVILRQFHAQTSRLNAYRGVALWIEAGRTAQNFGGDLILLEGYSGVIQGVFGQVSQQTAKGFRRVKAMAFCKPLYLLEALIPTD